MTEKTVQEFIERMGIAAQADGLPRIAGRMFGYFVIEGGTHSFSELADQLSVSRGSVSTNARLLEALGILERITRPGDRQDYFRLADDPYGQLMQGYSERMRKISQIVDETLNAMPRSQQASRIRLGEMKRFYETAVDYCCAVLKKWREPADKSA